MLLKFTNEQLKLVCVIENGMIQGRFVLCICRPFKKQKNKKKKTKSIFVLQNRRFMVMAMNRLDPLEMGLNR